MYSTLKIKSEDGHFISSNITIDGNNILGLRKIEISASAEDDLFCVKLETLAKLDMDISANMGADTIVFVKDQAYKLVPCKE